MIAVIIFCIGDRSCGHTEYHALWQEEKRKRRTLRGQRSGELDEPENEGTTNCQKSRREKQKPKRKSGLSWEQLNHGFRKKKKEAQSRDEDDYFDDEEEYIEEEHPINRAYREWNDYEDEIPSQF